MRNWGTLATSMFDDQDWTVRFAVVETGVSLNSRTVLIAPQAITREDLERIAIALSSEYVRNSPSVDAETPVAKRFEEALNEYYGWPPRGAESGKYPNG